MYFAVKIDFFCHSIIVGQIVPATGIHFVPGINVSFLQEERTLVCSFCQSLVDNVVGSYNNGTSIEDIKEHVVEICVGLHILSEPSCTVVINNYTVSFCTRTCTVAATSKMGTINFFFCSDPVSLRLST